MIEQKTQRLILSLLVVILLIIVSMSNTQAQSIDHQKKENELIEYIFSEMKGKNQNPYRAKDNFFWPNHESISFDLQAGSLDCISPYPDSSIQKFSFSEFDINRISDLRPSQFNTKKWSKENIREVRASLTKRSKAVRIGIGTPFFIENYNSAVVFERTNFNGNLLIYRWQNESGWRLYCSYRLWTY